MKKLNITKKQYEESKYFNKKYGSLKFVSESGKLFKTDKGVVLALEGTENQPAEGDGAQGAEGGTQQDESLKDIGKALKDMRRDATFENVPTLANQALLIAAEREGADTVNLIKPTGNGETPNEGGNTNPSQGEGSQNNGNSGSHVRNGGFAWDKSSISADVTTD